jgi:hypothetical protein
MTVPAFTAGELQAIHRYCVKYRALVRSGGSPTQMQDERFLLFSRVCYTEGVAYG